MKTSLWPSECHKEVEYSQDHVEQTHGVFADVREPLAATKGGGCIVV